jgi:histidinol-phosphate/aromatic aminotransferase/cobyric acid decarboxylase-like protein/GNAT superfamily N-acetyltransferase
MGVAAHVIRTAGGFPWGSPLVSGSTILALALIAALRWRPNNGPAPGSRCLRMALVPPNDRQQLFDIRKRVYARELGQYPTGTEETAPIVIGIYDGQSIAAYIGLKPGEKSGEAYEMKALTVLPAYRRRGLAKALILAAFRYVQTSGVEVCVLKARAEILPFYERHGFQPKWSEKHRIGRVEYVPGHVNIRGFESKKIKEFGVFWDLPFSEVAYKTCVHGSGSTEEDPKNCNVVRADVLDAWYAPAPSVIESLRRLVDDPSGSYVKRSPSTPNKLARDIAVSRGVPDGCVVLGAGSSDLMYRVLVGMWLRPESQVLLLTPTYAEYPHILRNVIGCRVDEWHESRGVDVFLEKAAKYDFAIMVNPNSPTGSYVQADTLVPALRRLPPTTRVWIDETYVEHVGGASASLERVAVSLPNVVVCKSMSKAYALSGLRVAYLCGHPMQIEPVRSRTPPWVLGAPALLAAQTAIQEGAYYASRIRETHELRDRLCAELTAVGCTIHGAPRANFVLCSPPTGICPRAIGDRLRQRGVYIKDDSGVDGAMRLTVLDTKASSKLVQELWFCINGTYELRERPCAGT